jgi:hypothetical protein
MLKYLLTGIAARDLLDGALDQAGVCKVWKTMKGLRGQAWTTTKVTS